MYNQNSNKTNNPEMSGKQPSVPNRAHTEMKNGQNKSNNKNNSSNAQNNSGNNSQNKATGKSSYNQSK